MDDTSKLPKRRPRLLHRREICRKLSVRNDYEEAITRKERHRREDKVNFLLFAKLVIEVATRMRENKINEKILNHFAMNLESEESSFSAP